MQDCGLLRCCRMFYNESDGELLGIISRRDELCQVSQRNLIRSLGMAQGCRAAIVFFVLAVIMEPDPPPKALRGRDWLFTQGARSETRREVATSSASPNPEYNYFMRGLAQRTWAEPSSQGAADWQHELREHQSTSLKPMNFQPSRMMFYCDGRPVVVPRSIFFVWQSHVER